MLHRRRTQITVVLCIVALCLLARRMSSTTFFLASTEDVGNGPIARDVKQSPSISSSAGQFSHIPCVINSEVRKNVGLPPKKVEVKCLADESKDNIYVPFSFVKKYFDIYGSKGGTDKTEHLAWSHSYSRVFPPLIEHKYDPGGSYLQFASFDVENRPRVKCVSARMGVPITTQWDKRGYYYATQICQYALAHWSKAFNSEAQTEKPVAILFEDGNNTFNGAVWSGGEVLRVLRDKCVQFDRARTLSLGDSPGQTVLSFDLLVRDKPSVTVSISNPEVGRYTVQYIPDQSTIHQVGRTVYLGYDNEALPLPEGTWKSFTRNVVNDLLKGLPQTHVTQTLKHLTQPWTVESLTVGGVGCITNVSLAQSQHLRMFFHGADWLVSSQNTSTGAWHVEITFNAKRSKYPLAQEMQPGWISGMSLGHAMSVLSRAYRASGDERYIECAVKALRQLSVPSSQGGVEAKFMDKYVWYEEYPTQPSSFVLNGFMYSLVGLYDLWQTLMTYESVMEISAKASSIEQTKDLFEKGVNSLKNMLPLYDTGSGTSYDLRHFTMGGAPKLARWDYHSTHINLLYLLSTMVDDESSETFSATAKRWLGYMVGQRADHN